MMAGRTRMPVGDMQCTAVTVCSLSADTHFPTNHFTLG